MEEEIYKSLTKGVRRPKHKVAMFMCGAAGTGKTSMRETFLKDIGMKSSFVYLNIDDIRKHVKSQEEAQVFIKKLVSRTVDDGYSLMWDATCRNKSAILPAMESMKSKGYKIVLGMVYASLNTVLRRVAKRTEQPVEESIVRDIYQHMMKNAEVYMDKEFIDEIYLYNNEKTAILMFSKSDKSVQCHSPDLKFYFDVSKYC